MDPRGPLKECVEINIDGKAGKVKLSCGHIREFNPIYSYKVGEKYNCLLCKVTTV